VFPHIPRVRVCPGATRRVARQWNNGLQGFTGAEGCGGKPSDFVRAICCAGDASRIHAPQSRERTRSRKVILRTVYTGGSAVVRRGRGAAAGALAKIQERLST